LSAQLRLSVTKKTGPAPPERQPGDSVELDPVTQDIVAVSNGMTIRLPLENLIKPELTMQVTRSGPEFTYAYTLANGAEAQQTIMYFGFECRYPEDVQLSAPDKWRADKVPPNVNNFRSLAFGHILSDNDRARRLWNGQKAGPFQMVSRLHPGLVRVHVVALPAEKLSTELSKDEKLRFLSPWALERLNVFDTTDRTMKYLLSVGPRIPADDDSLTAIRSELAYASGQPEFNDVSVQLGNLARASAKEELQKQLAAIKGSGLQAMFYQALLWRLEVVKQ
jgi:hypothetical protein